MSAAPPRAFATLLVSLLPVVAAHSDTCADAGSTPGSLVVRLEAALLLQTLNAELLSHDSATRTLERWCSTHQLASPARIVAERVHGVAKAPTDEQRQQLRISAQDEVRYRRVRLRCGSLVLSEADNWYVPARLTPAMNRVLETSDTPFGVAVQELHFQRHTVSAEILWTVVPPGWEMRRQLPAQDVSDLCVPIQVLQHRAVLALPDGTPFSEVVETYTGNVLAVPALEPRHSC